MEYDDIHKWVWGVLADDDTQEIEHESVETIAARIRTLEAANAQLAADNRVLAAEVRARRLNTKWACHQDDPDALDVYEWMIEAQHATDASGALERNKP